MQREKFQMRLFPSEWGIPNQLYISVLVFIVFAGIAVYDRRKPKGWVTAFLAGLVAPFIVYQWFSGAP